MKIQTLETYIKRTTKPYGDLLRRAEKGGLKVEYDEEGIVIVSDTNNRTMVLYFENEDIYKNNLDNGLIKTVYNYSK